MAASTIEPSADAGEASVGKAGAETALPPVVRRKFWRAVVRSGSQVGASRERDRVEWHLASCPVPNAEGAHCTEGQHLIETTGHPDGHCIVDGACGVCGQPAASAEEVSAVA